MTDRETLRPFVGGWFASGKELEDARRAAELAQQQREIRLRKRLEQICDRKERGEPA